MPIPLTPAQLADALDARFHRIYQDRYEQLPDMLPTFFQMEGQTGPQKADVRFSEMGTFGDVPEFSGVLVDDDINQGYDSTVTHKEYASGFQVTLTMVEDDLYQVIDKLPSGLATALARTRQKHGASIFNNAFSVDSTWLSRSEGVAMCSNSHTTTSGASTTTGFDNLVTTALSAVSLQAAKLQLWGLRDDRGNQIEIDPDTIIHPPELDETVYEIIKSAGKVDTANNNANIHQGRYTGIMWKRLTDANNWWLADGTMMKDSLHWYDRVKAALASVEVFETFVGRWRIRARWSVAYSDWRFCVGGQVS